MTVYSKTTHAVESQHTIKNNTFQYSLRPHHLITRQNNRPFHFLIKGTILQLHCQNMAHFYPLFRKSEALLNYSKTACGGFETFFPFFPFHVLHRRIYLYLGVLASVKPECCSNYKINSNSNIHHSISIRRGPFWLDRLTPRHSRGRLMSA